MISRLYEKKQVNSLQERSSHEEIPEDQILCSDFRPNPGTWMKVFLSILIPEVNHIICRKGGATQGEQRLSLSANKGLVE